MIKGTNRQQNLFKQQDLFCSSNNKFCPLKLPFQTRKAKTLTALQQGKEGLA